MSEYKVYLDGVLMPLGIDKLETKIKNRNEDVDLINGKVQNIPKDPGLTTWKFNVLLPAGSIFDGRKIEPLDFYLAHFEKLKQSKKPFRFIVTRSNVLNPKKENDKDYKPILSNFGLSETNVAVTLEDYKRLEDSDLGLHSKIEVNLKQYAEYQAQKIVVIIPKPEPEPSPEPEPEEPKTELEIKIEEQLKRIENRDIPTIFKTYWVPTDKGGRYLMTWKDVSKTIFGFDDYWRGIRDTNLDKSYGYWDFSNGKKHTKMPMYPAPDVELSIDVETILTIVITKYPDDLND